MVPFLHQNVGGQFTPKTVEIIFVGRGAQNAMEIQILGSVFVVSNFKKTFGL